MVFDAWRASFELYRAQDAESAQVRAEHLSALDRQTPVLMAANLVNALMLLASMGGWHLQGAWAWLAALVAMVALALHGRWRRRGRRFTSASVRAMHRGTLRALLLAALWAVPALFWFDGAPPGQQLAVACLTLGMMAGGAFALYALPLAALAWLGVLLLGAVTALLTDGGSHAPMLTVLVLCFAATLAVSVLAGERKATMLARAQREATRQRQMVALLLRDFEDHAAEALWETGPDGCLTHVSPRLATLLGCEQAALFDRPLLHRVREASADAAVQLRMAFDAGRPFHDLRLAVPDGQAMRWWTLSGKPLFDEAGRSEGWRGVIADISTEVQAEQRLHRMAHVDALTGLANRLTLHEALGRRLAAGLPGALLSVDLDRFKAINDSLGHSSGDAVLQAVAERLSAGVRPGDVVARLGGDEFALLALSVADGAAALALGERLIQALEAPIVIGERHLSVGASIGAVLLHAHGDGVDEVLGHADLALYQAKEGGRGRCVLYDSALGERSRRRTALEQGLRPGLAAGQFELHWQPQVELQPWRVVGAEALLRWRHPTLGPVSPAEFVPMAEQTGQIQALGDWVLRQAVAAAAGPLRGLTVSVNVSPAQLRDEAFGERVRELLLHSRIDPRLLELEITESIFLDGVEGALQRLQALHRLGVRVALDDFGTGYSSLAYLRRFAFDTLKIDRAFVSELLRRPDTQAIVRTIVQLAQQLGMRTIAEGVENEAQLAAVAATRCDHVQGYLVAMPCTLDEFVALRRRVEARRPQPAALH